MPVRDDELGDELIALAAQVVFERGGTGAGARMRDQHGRDRLGRCHGCSHSGTAAPLYPCRLRTIGEVAAGLELLAARPERATGAAR
ncbi:hypothetical protein [Pseudonocardia sp. HH130630-07]|uniref:hypothetical protein n=1 Tax=Pseudonocardia sp. HH130630-07 TaxID=1690815 RepID=UPI0008150AEE|nr:hypothetical protein [Pseudonocardia sp. HH130630-07]ANY05318.1 hypothetical protein AFB00_02190 [Pseudonocardia sp. HH130630-07]